MQVYEEGTDRFSDEYLAYLGTLNYEVTVDGENRERITKNPAGEVVRIETWTRETYGESEYIYGYQDQHLPGWMKP